MARPEYLTKKITAVKDPGVREIIRVVDQYIRDQDTEKLVDYIGSLQREIVDMQKILNAHGISR